MRRIENNIKFGCPEASHEQVVEAAKKARCHDFISLLPEGYNTMIGEGGSTLSGGEKQRISIARAMLKNAPVVLLDEATASVDPENEVYLQQAISTLVKDKTLIVIAHRLSTIRDAEQILVIDNGKLVQHGKHDELVLQERKGKAAVSGCFLNCSSLEKSSAQSRTLELFGQTSNQEIKYIIDGLSILGGKLRNFCVKLIILLSYTRINDIAKYHISRNTECVHNIN